MSNKWRWLLIGYIWALPWTLICLFAFKFVYKSTGWQWREGVLTCVGGVNADGTSKIWGKPGAQTGGWAQCFKSEEARNSPNLRVHENCHVVQNFVLGPLWPISYGVIYIVLLIIHSSENWTVAYHLVPYESWAYARQGAYLKETNNLETPNWRWGSQSRTAVALGAA